MLNEFPTEIKHMFYASFITGMICVYPDFSIKNVYMVLVISGFITFAIGINQKNNNVH
jgi:hypothetical protein